MKKVIIILTMLLLITGCQQFSFEETSDSIKFKEEYEQLNNQKSANNNEYLKLNISSKNPFQYLPDDEVIKFLEEGTGIIYFGLPTCPYCRSTLEPLIEFAKNNKLNTIYYYNPEQIRKDNSAEYQKIVEILKAFLKTDTVNQSEDDIDFDPNLKRLLMPDVYFVNKGRIVSHYAESKYKTKLDKNQLKEVIGKYQSVYEDYVGSLSICNEEC